MVFLKLKVEGDGAAVFASAIRVHPEEDLTELYRLGVLHQDLADDPGNFGLDLVHDFHRFDDADRLAGRHPVAHPDVSLRSGLWGLVERANHRGSDLLQVDGRRSRTGSRIS